MTDREENIILKEKIRKLEANKTSNIKRRNWTLKKLVYFFIGNNLKNNILKLINEINQKNITKDTIANLASSVIKRVTRVGIFTIIIGFIPLILLYNQNRLLNIQNDKISEQTILFNKQTELIDQQLLLSEASRRSGQMVLLSEILKDINTELEKKDNLERILSNSLVGRIISLTESTKPYRYLENGVLIEKPLSPERGQLLFAIAESKIDTSFVRQNIFNRANFYYSDLKNYDLFNFYLAGAHLNYSNLSNSTIRNCDFSGSEINAVDFSNAKIRHSSFYKSNMLHVNFNNATIYSSSFKKSNISYTNFQEAMIYKVSFEQANLSEAIFNDATISSTRDITYFEKTIVDRKDWITYIRDSLKLRGSEEIFNHYKIDSSSKKFRNQYYHLVKKIN